MIFLLLVACISSTLIEDTAMLSDSADTACYEQRWTIDQDGDGWGWYDPALPQTVTWQCSDPSGQGPAGYVLADGDCDDTRNDTHPGAPDRAGDGLDTNCDGRD